MITKQQLRNEITKLQDQLMDRDDYMARHHHSVPSKDDAGNFAYRQLPDDVRIMHSLRCVNPSSSIDIKLEI
jgi:hypothetical protein